MRISQSYAHDLTSIHMMRMWTSAVRSAIPVERQRSQCEDVMATGYIPTVGEYAERILDSFATLQTAAEFPPNQQPVAARAAAIEFVRACVALLRKFPAQARIHFAAQMPFTNRELELISHENLDDPRNVDAIVLRLLGWVNQNPAVIEAGYAPPAGFLRRLAPHLDLWDSRQRAMAAADELVG
jgi:hypothetical protein